MKIKHTNFRRGRTALISFAALTVLFAGCSHHKDKDTSDAPPKVSVAQAKVDSVVLHKDYPGMLTADATARVVGEVSGRLLSKHYESGSYVRKGQLLFTIDPSTYSDAVKQAAAQLESARSQEAYYTTQTAALKKALATNAVSRMEVAQAESNLEAARASVNSAAAALSTARTRLAKCSVTAPISGYISDSELSAGNYIDGEGSPVLLATIYDTSTCTLEFDIEDTQYESMTSADPSLQTLFNAVPLSFRQAMPREYFARLNYRSPSVSTSTGTLTMKGTVANPDNLLKAGMYVTVHLPVGVSPHAVLVEDAALSSDQLGKYLYVVNDSNRVVYTPVTVGETYQDTLRIIEKGIRPGQRYVTKALLSVRNGMEVDPIK